MSSNFGLSPATSNTHSTHKNETKNGAHGTNKPIIYELLPPKWRPRLHPGSRSIGAPDIYIRKQNQSEPAEDEMSEVNVRNGLNARPAVGNETFSAHDMIYDRLKGKQVVQQLGSLFEEVAQRRNQLAGLRCGPSASQYRQPQRVTLNEVKLAAYVKELADPSVPIGKLAKSVPHGYRGERMLDMLWNGGSISGAMAAMKSQPTIGSNTNNNTNASAPGGERSGLPNSVEIARAVWFIRVVGASEISSSRLRQGNSITYTTEWTATFMGWLRRQIVEIIISHHHSTVSESPAAPPSPMPSRNRSSISTPQHTEEHYAMILEDDFRERWMAKWNYSLALLRALANEGLIDSHVAARFSIDMFRTANVAQIFITLALFQEFLDVIANSVTLSQLALSVLIAKLKDMEEQATSSSILLQKEIRAMLLYLFDTRPDCFVSPSCWPDLSTIVHDSRKASTMNPNLKAIQERNEKLISSFTSLTRMENEESFDLVRLQDLQILDQIPAHEDIRTTFEIYFGRKCISISERICTLLIWATSEWRVGTHRPFAVATMLDMYLRYQPSRSQKRTTHKSKEGKRMVLERIDLDAIVMSWITNVDSAKKKTGIEEEGEGNASTLRWHNVLVSTSLSEMIILIGELCRLGCFSFQKYLQRLTARGLTAMGGRETKTDSQGVNGRHSEIPTSDSIHSKLLRSVPLISCPKPLEHQRKVAIYGNRAKESREEAMERRALRELSSAFPWLSGSQETEEEEMNFAQFDVRKHVQHFWKSSRYVQSKIIQLHLLPSYRKYVYERQALQDYQLSRFVTLLVQIQEYASLQEVLEDISQHSQNYDEKIVKLADSYAKQNQLVLSCMGSVFRSDDEDLMKNEEGHLSQEKNDSVLEEKGISSEEIPSSILLASFNAFVGGQHSQSMELIQNRYVRPSALLGIANGVLSEGNIEQFMDWAKSLPFKSKNEPKRWAQDFSTCLQDKDVLNVNIDTLINLAIAQTTANPHSFVYIIRSVCLPVLNATVDGLSDLVASNLRAVVGLLSGIFLPSPRDGFNRSWVLLEKGAGVSLAANHSDDILRMLCALKKAEIAVFKSDFTDDLASLRAGISHNEHVRCLMQMNLKNSMDLVRSLIPANNFHILMQELLPARWPWAADEDLIDRINPIFENVDQWRWEQILCESAIIIEAIQNKTKEGSINSNKLNDFARIFSDRVLSSVDSACASLSVSHLLSSLSNSNSALFSIGLIDERFRMLNKQLEATFTDETKVKSELENILRLWQKMTPMTISASVIAAQTFRFVTEWFESNLPPSPVQEGILNPQDSDSLFTDRGLPNGEMAVRLGIVCFLMKLDNILLLPITKSIAPRLFCVIIRLALNLSHLPDTGEKKVETILDVARYLLQQAPLELQQAMRQRALEQIETELVTQPSLLDSATEMIGRLINNDADALGPNLTSSIGGRRISLIEAQSSSSALSDGQFSAVQIKPWDLHPNVEAPIHGKVIAQHSAADSNPGAVQSITSFTEMNNLSNNGPISLHHFRAYRTLDRLPESSSLPLKKKATLDPSPIKVPFILPSEQNYGMNLAGQPVYARDAIRGLLAISNNTIKMKLSPHDLQQLVPALCPPTKHKHQDLAADKPVKNAKKDTSNEAKKRNASNANENNTRKTAASKGKPDKKDTRNEKGAESKANITNTNTTARKRKTSNASAQGQKVTKAATNAASRKRAKKA